MPQINGQKVGPIGYGLMGLSWRPDPPTDDVAFACMRAALEAGANFWNGGEIYRTPSGDNSATLLSRYFAKYPEDADRVILSIKGAVGDPAKGVMRPDGSPEEIGRSIETTLSQLGGTKKQIELFEAARIDRSKPLSVTLGAIKSYVDRGLVGGISLSEVSAATIHEAVKIAKVEAVEVELSMWSTDVLTNGVAAACAEHGIPLVAYSPLGRGMLAGRYKSPTDLPEGDFRRHMPRFHPDNFAVNLQLVSQVEALAARKGCTPAQLAIAWVRAVGSRPGMPVVIPLPGGSTPERVAENMKIVELTGAEWEEISETLKKFDVRGTRYPEGMPIEL
ncbi:putative pyridoxal reductase [Coniochaeta ligniaria NRRL 30616]|uniref:Putative pyridoxal reductase n=1 Tax=Coniochaeta ligniaria NRRL 30616 TaxID=1408157 RepID=A0A1J7J876_9PEZI|nr:putative pyridoxal reductase [Coniochaeta ligniaria NRRL 30616]